MRQMYGGGVGLLLSLGIAAVMWYLMLGGPRTYPIGLAFGNVQGNAVDVHMVVTILMADTDPLDTVTLADGTEVYQNTMEYIHEHFRLEGADGKTLEWTRLGHSNLITPHGAMVPEYFLAATLDVGEAYAIEYQPHRDEPKFYRLRFTAPAEAKAYELTPFEEVK
jgi:hypothetical protein